MAQVPLAVVLVAAPPGLAPVRTASGVVSDGAPEAVAVVAVVVPAVGEVLVAAVGAAPVAVIVISRLAGLARTSLRLDTIVVEWLVCQWVRKDVWEKRFRRNIEAFLYVAWHRDGTISINVYTQPSWMDGGLLAVFVDLSARQRDSDPRHHFAHHTMASTFLGQFRAQDHRVVYDKTLQSWRGLVDIYFRCLRLESIGQPKQLGSFLSGPNDTTRQQ